MSSTDKNMQTGDIPLESADRQLEVEAMTPEAFQPEAKDTGSGALEYNPPLDKVTDNKYSMVPKLGELEKQINDWEGSDNGMSSLISQFDEIKDQISTAKRENDTYTQHTLQRSLDKLSLQFRQKREGWEDGVAIPRGDK